SRRLSPDEYLLTLDLPPRPVRMGRMKEREAGPATIAAGSFWESISFQGYCHQSNVRFESRRLIGQARADCEASGRPLSKQTVTPLDFVQTGSRAGWAESGLPATCRGRLRGHRTAGRSPSNPSRR